MDDKTRGIVLQSLRYGDSDLIVKVFTHNYGLKSYMVKGAFKHNAKNRVAFFQQLNIINYVEVGNPKTASLGYLKDVQMTAVYHSLPFEMNKSAIVMYVGELLSKTLNEQEKNEPLYDFIEQCLLWLDIREDAYANFPLYFTLELTRHLGFYPKTNHREGYCFDMMEGQFAQDHPLHPYYFDANNAVQLSKLLDAGIEDACRQPMSIDQRRQLLDGLITFMRLHAPVMKGLKSHEVLKTLFV